VRVLMVGSRQVTLSVYRQLDTVPPARITPFGRVRDKSDEDAPWAPRLHVVGACNGQLVRSSIKQAYRPTPLDIQWPTPPRDLDEERRRAVDEARARENHLKQVVAWNAYVEWANLPLVVLAGLR